METLLNPIGIAIAAVLGGGAMAFKALYWDRRKAKGTPVPGAEGTTVPAPQPTTASPASAPAPTFTTLLKTNAPAGPAPVAVGEKAASTEVTVPPAQPKTEVVSQGNTALTASQLQLEQVGKGKKGDGYLTMVIGSSTVTWQYLKKPFGKVWQADATIPLHGGAYFFCIYETPNGERMHWDPNNIPLIAEQTPLFLWGAMRLPAILVLFRPKPSALEQFSKILPIIALGLAGLAVFSVIGGH